MLGFIDHATAAYTRYREEFPWLYSYIILNQGNMFRKMMLVPFRKSLIVSSKLMRVAGSLSNKGIRCHWPTGGIITLASYPDMAVLPIRKN